MYFISSNKQVKSWLFQIFTRNASTNSKSELHLCIHINNRISLLWWKWFFMSLSWERTYNWRIKIVGVPLMATWTCAKQITELWNHQVIIIIITEISGFFHSIKRGLTIIEVGGSFKSGYSNSFVVYFDLFRMLVIITSFFMKKTYYDDLYYSIF